MPIFIFNIKEETANSIFDNIKWLKLILHVYVLEHRSNMILRKSLYC